MQNPRTLRLAHDLSAQVEAIADAQIRGLVAAWVAAWDEVAPDLDAALTELVAEAAGGRVTRAMVLRSGRLQNALAVVSTRLQALAAAAGVRIAGDVDEVVNRAGEVQAEIVAAQLPPAERWRVTAWSRVSAEQVAQIVARSVEQITARAFPISAEASYAIRRELVRGIAAGSNPRAVARRMVERTQGHFNGGLTRAMVIARTEMLDAQRRAAALAHEANADVLAGWVWLAELSPRTCPACFAMHGTLHSLAEPGPLGHQQCRCTRQPRTRTWRELGIDADEPEDLTPDAGAYFGGLDSDTQRSILGRAGFEAWSRGEFPLTEWARRRRTDGWRDSYVPARPPRRVNAAG